MDDDAIGSICRFTDSAHTSAGILAVEGFVWAYVLGGSCTCDIVVRLPKDSILPGGSLSACAPMNSPFKYFIFSDVLSICIPITFLSFLLHLTP